MLTETEKAYLAGMIDGDGCIHITLSHTSAGTRVHVLRVIITQANHDYLAGLQAKIGCGSIYTNKRSPHICHLCFSGATAERVLRYVYDHLDVKKEQARIALEFRKTKGRQGQRYAMRGYQGGGTVSVGIEDIRQYYADELKRLKIVQDKDRPNKADEPPAIELARCQLELPIP